MKNVTFLILFIGEHEPEDTPSSPGRISNKERKLPELPDTARKENRADIEDKFGKFELPHPHPRERHSTLVC